MRRPTRALLPLRRRRQHHPTLTGAETLMDEFEYVTAGVVYKYKPDTSGPAPRLEVYASFGGLLLRLKGDPVKLGVLGVDDKIYMLLRRV